VPFVAYPVARAVFEALAGLVGMKTWADRMFPSALGVSTFPAEAQSPLMLVRQKGQITPALSILPASKKTS
jgi:hypothetical protein